MAPTAAHLIRNYQPKPRGATDPQITSAATAEPTTTEVKQWGRSRAVEAFSLQRPQLKFKDITDGLSQTILGGEVSSQQRHWDGPVGGAWLGGPRYLKGDALFFRDTHASHPINVQLPDATIQNSVGDQNGFGSRHPGAAHFVFCDGSTHFIDENIASSSSPLGTYQRLGHKSDGLTVGDF